MLHTPGFAPPRPLKVPFLIAAGGPRSIAVARKVENDVANTMPIGGFAWSIVLTAGTVLEDGENPRAERSLAAAGHRAAVLLHAGAERGLLDTLLPEQGRQWLSAYDAVPAERRHLAMHSGHLVLVNAYDRPYITGELLAKLGLAQSAAGWRERLAQLEAAGATEVAYQLAGPDIVRELEAFINAARS